MFAFVANLLGAGLVLALFEITWVLLRARGLFLGIADRFVFTAASATAMASAVLVIGLLSAATTHAGRPAKWLKRLLSLGAGALSARLLWLLSEGRRVRDASLRPLLVVVLALAAIALTFALLSALSRLRPLGTRARWSLVAGCAATSLLALVTDALILPRGYPAFHLGLWLLAVCAASYAGLLTPLTQSPRTARRAAVLGGLLLLLAPLSLSRLAAHPTASFAVRERAPWSARLMALASSQRERTASGDVALSYSSVRAQGGIDLRDRDVLLITVDALRADMLRAYGGRGKTPELDRLAAESVVFLRAYTPAPHTSYALTSLLTGKFVKPLVELGQKLGDPQTLPDRLRRYGYRTAAFYPPAIFFVDGASFRPLQERGFGFEYRKEMFASADKRVAQLSDYLAHAEPKPLFAWVHLFEPHEPYDPPKDLAHDGSERGRYEAEVVACDRAIAALVAVFRRARPAATVIVTADHGEEFGDHGGSFHGNSLYDEQVRVPLLWSSPGAAEPRHTSVPVELVDVGTTILSSAGVPLDPHMRGDDLSAVLIGKEDRAPRFAFSSIDRRNMVTNGREKAICGLDEAHCALFDLVNDPGELHNASSARVELVDHLQREIDRFMTSISHTEAVSVGAGVALPDVLARAKLGADARELPLLPLLSHERPAVRAETARVLGEQRVVSALAALEQARVHDRAAVVRAEAAIAALQLEATTALADVSAIVTGGGSDDEAQSRMRRAALALAPFKREEAVPLLSELLLDERATEGERVRAARALGALGSSAGEDALIAALGSVRLRAPSATALGELGGARALAALREQLAGERYPAARRALAEALLKLRDAQLASSVRHFLGMESSLPGGLDILHALGELAPASRAGALLRDAHVREGSWRCDERGCSPGAHARIVLPRRGPLLRGTVRVVLSYTASGAQTALHVDGVRLALHGGEQQLSFEREASAATQFSIASEGDVALLAIAIVPSVPEIPPPAPQPWDAGARKTIASP
jgi:arylsulfatase A-like enzyme